MAEPLHKTDTVLGPSTTRAGGDVSCSEVVVGALHAAPQRADAKTRAWAARRPGSHVDGDIFATPNRAQRPLVERVLAWKLSLAPCVLDMGFAFALRLRRRSMHHLVSAIFGHATRTSCVYWWFGQGMYPLRTL